jgi:UPF0755 protein
MMKKKIIIILTAVVLCMISALTVVLFDIYGVTGDSESVTITVDEGEPFRSVLVKLSEEKIILSDKIFLGFLKISGINPQISFGEHVVNSSMSYEEILKALSGYSYREEISVTIPSALNVDEIAAILESKGVCSKKEFLTASKQGKYSSKLLDKVSPNFRITYKAEGYLYPETYMFYPNDDPERVLEVLLSQTDSVITDDMLTRAEQLGLSVNELVTFASIVEEECCGYFEEMPKVAKIFWNRLNNWGKDTNLQSDPTCLYPYNSDYYNTYKVGGLPIGPICNVTKEALNAVLYPSEDLDGYYFFVTDKNVKFYYNTTDDKHEQTIASLKRQGLWQN